MSLALSTKVKLLSVLEDIELLSKSLFDALATRESGSAPGGGQPPELNCDSLVDQLRLKEAELHHLRAQAASQQLVQAKIAHLRAQLEQRDQEIAGFQRNLKEADRLLTVAIYYSRQKLESLQTARQNPGDSEELVKFAHKISASNGVMAPLGWGLGDPRRPYPTAGEMDRGFLRHIDEMGNFRQEIADEVAASTADNKAGGGGSGGGASGGQAAAAAAPGRQQGGAAAVTGQQQQQQQQQQTGASAAAANEVETMSSDSSSSSSSED